MTSPSADLKVVDIDCEGCKWRERINAELAERIKLLEDDLKFERSFRGQAKSKKDEEILLDDWLPVGGFKSMRQRIADAELKARQDADKNNETIREDATSGS